jgi:hypothetical protein
VGILCLPDYRHANPFQDLLYAGLDEVELWQPESPGGVLHLQWEDGLFRDAPDAGAADTKVDALLRLLDLHQQAGGRLIWTLHNLTAHNCTYKEAERTFRAGIVQRADAVHIMAERHRAALPAGCEAKVHVIPHPSYADHYPRTERTTARAKLGVGGRPLFFHFGAPRTNRAYDVLQGPTVDNPAVSKIFSLPGSSQQVDRPGLRILDRRLSDAELGITGSAADFSIFADTEILNSGTLGFYLDFGMMVFVEKSAVEWIDLPDYPPELVFEGALDPGHMNAMLSDPGLRARMDSFLAARAVRVAPGRVADEFAALVAAISR